MDLLSTFLMIAFNSRPSSSDLTFPFSVEFILILATFGFLVQIRLRSQYPSADCILESRTRWSWDVDSPTNVIKVMDECRECVLLGCKVGSSSTIAILIYVINASPSAQSWVRLNYFSGYRDLHSNQPRTNVATLTSLGLTSIPLTEARSSQQDDNVNIHIYTEDATDRIHRLSIFGNGTRLFKDGYIDCRTWSPDLWIGRD